MSAVEIRRATVADLAGIVTLLADDDLGRGREDASLEALPRYQAAFANLERDANQLPVVLLVDGVVTGYLQITFIPGLSRQGMWRGLIESVRIDKQMRGQKLGEALMRFAIDACRARACKLVQLTTDKTRADAHRFYVRLGFVASHEGMKLAL
ncbi:MAG: GNAT family N-acetyltransferase [Hyphomicrobiaceae bacterium]